MDLLKRSLSPVLPEAWAAIDEEATRVLKLHLAGRKIADFRGPFGWAFAAVNTGRLEPLVGATDPSIDVSVRRVQPLVELRVPIELSIAELDSVARGAVDPDLDPVVQAAETIARAEDTAVFKGFPAAGITGLLAASPHPPQAVPKDLSKLPEAILAGKDTLRRAGVSGPYALVLGARLYDQVYAFAEDGEPLAKRIEPLLVTRVIRASALEGEGAVLSLRGGDYELTVGQDLSIGYACHDRAKVTLYLTESFTFRVLEPAAAVRLG